MPWFPPRRGGDVSRQERLSTLADFVVENGAVRVEDVVRELGISPATARRDLDALAEQQLIIRTRGHRLEGVWHRLTWI